MFNPNQAGTIYYGTELKYLEEIDQKGIYQPRYRKEQYISVSISGYHGVLPCSHPELECMARVFSKELKVADYENGYLHYYEGYTNSLTCFQGFGICPNQYIHTFDGLVKNSNQDEKITVVLSENASSYLVRPDEKNTYEYLSLALHCFLKELREENIVGYIVSTTKLDYIHELIKNKRLKNRQIWTENDFENREFSEPDSAKYRICE